MRKYFWSPWSGLYWACKGCKKSNQYVDFCLPPTPLIIIILQDLFTFAPRQQIVNRLCWTQSWKVLACTFCLFSKIKLEKATSLTRLMMIWIFVLSSEICTGARDPLRKTICPWWTTSAPSPTRPPSVICTGAKGHPSFQPFHSRLLWGMENRRGESIGRINNNKWIIGGLGYYIIMIYSSNSFILPAKSTIEK